MEPGDADYDAARAGWNSAIDRHPAAIAYPGDLRALNDVEVDPRSAVVRAGGGAAE